MHVLITGGVGFIGQYVARRLLADGHTVSALDSLHPQVHLDPDAAVASFPGEVVVGDVALAGDWDAAVAAARPDAVVHLAAETGTGQSMYEPERYHRVNVGGTREAGRVAAALGVPLVALSSRAVYGEGRYSCPDHGTTYPTNGTAACCERRTPEPSREDDPHQPVSVYGETKSAGEAELADAAARVPVTVIRPQNVIGAGQALHNPYTGVLAAFLAQLREGRAVTVYGTGLQTRDFVHVDDLARLIVWALAHPAEPGLSRTLNCGSGERTTLLELARHAIAGSPRAEAPITHLDVHRAGDIAHACADLSRLRELGAPEPAWTTARAVADFIAHGWDRPGASASVWDDALEELSGRGLTS